MLKRSVAVLVAFTFLFSTGCISLRTAERYQYEELEERLPAVGLDIERSKDPALAGVLNILPGIGNAYLGQWGLFAVNFLFWPLSVVWGIPQAAIDAGTINKQDTVYYYSFGGGAKWLAKLEKEKQQEKGTELAVEEK